MNVYRAALTCRFAAAIALTAVIPAAAGEHDGRLDIYFIDVEGGAATLFVTPSGESMLIDSGYPDNNGRDRDRILAAAGSAELKRIDHAVVTHWHLDHYGNHAALASKIPIGQFWDRGIPDALSEDPTFVDRVADYRRASQNRSKALRPGDKIPLKSGKTPLSVTTVTASREVIPNTGDLNPFADLHVPQETDTSDNAASLSLLLKFGSFDYLCCGDLSWNIEGKLVTPNNPLGQIDLFMVTHHGLPVSNNPALVLAIDPKVAVMCNGPTKGGHPETLHTLRKIKSLEALYQLHRNISLGPEIQAPAEFMANQEDTAECRGTYIKASVAPDGSSYTVQIGSSGQPRRFETRK
ncbi:MAG: MBL fold metallo-hydrolase [Planctomycetaceae bacterium]